MGQKNLEKADDDYGKGCIKRARKYHAFEREGTPQKGKKKKEKQQCKRKKKLRL